SGFTDFPLLFWKRSGRDVDPTRRIISKLVKVRKCCPVYHYRPGHRLYCNGNIQRHVNGLGRRQLRLRSKCAWNYA
uniref:Uncharacterized protein n=1 Tax=Ciona savignyi TaxID=51511 RepID=H2YVM1_CIOSA